MKEWKMNGSRTWRRVPSRGLPRTGVAWTLVVALFALSAPVARAAALGDPAVVIDAAPPDVQTVPLATIAFHSVEPTSCRLDGGPWSPCVSPVTYDALPNGPHTFDVAPTQATDAPAVTATWHVDVLTPHATISEEPPSVSGTADASFAFGGTTPDVAVASWGSPGAAAARFHDPSSIAVDPASGTVYVADRSNDRIEAYDPSGNLLLQWGTPGTGPGQFDAPAGIAVDPAGNVFVSDSGNDRIEEFDPQGTLLNMWGGTGTDPGEFRSPRGIAVSSGGTVYVADMYNDRIQALSEDGRVITVWGRTGSKDGRFRYPADVALGPDGRVYVSDYLNSRIQEFASDGSFVTSWGIFGSGDGQMAFPYGVATDAAGNVYVADTYHGRIEVFAGDGTPLTTWDGRSADGTRFDLPYDAAVAPDGTVYAVDLGADRVISLSSRASAFECALDGGDFQPCTSPTSFAELGYGEHTFSVRAMPADGTPGTPGTWSWTVTAGGPVTTIETAPETPTASTDAAIAFGSDAVAGPGAVTFACRLDAADWSACTSPVALSDLPAGAHTFDVRAIDGYGTVGEPATVAWEVDAAAPPSPDPAPTPDPSLTPTPSSSPSPTASPKPSTDPQPSLSPGS